MKVVYLGRPSHRNTAPPSPDGDVIELLANNWDDYGYKTSFPVTPRINDKLIELDLIRLLIDGASTSSTALDGLLQEGWDGTFPIPNANYISVPSDITFYEQLEGLIGGDGAREVAKALRDASYLIRVAENAQAIALSQTEGFKNSLQRERGSVKAFSDGWRVFDQQIIAVLELGFRFKDVYGDISTLNLKFRSDGPLPHDINVLIGPNGHGKSQTLHQIVQDWISPDEESEAGFLEKPNLSQIVVISYSPFERFPVDLAGWRLQDTDVYRYFGFRGRSEPTESKKRGSIRISHEFPKKNAAKSLIDCLRDDKKYKDIRNWARKLEVLELTIQAPFTTPLFDLHPLPGLTPEQARLVSRHVRELAIVPRYTRFFREQFRRLLRLVSRMRASGQDVRASLELFRDNVETPALNGWEHIFYEAVLQNPDFLDYLENEDLPTHM